jgi:YVTN family beta-propeller protein
LLPVVTLPSCLKDPSAPAMVETDTTYSVTGMYILNEGLYNMNDVSLTYYNFSDSTAHTDYFNLQNGRKLGDTGNDIAIYGSKMYIIVNVSSQLEVVDATTCKSIKQISFFNNSGVARQPRYIAFYKSKAYVCSFDGTVAVIDTSSLEIEKFITVGRNPDGIAVVNNKIYVSNSGGLDAPNYGTTLSVIDAEADTVLRTIAVGKNPFSLVPDKYGDLYVISRGNYADIKMKLQVVDTNADTVKYTFPELEALNLAINGDTAYVYYYNYNTASDSKIMLVDVKNEKLLRNNFITDGTTVETVYGIAVNKSTGDVFITDAHGFTSTGEVICFSREGTKKYSFTAGLNPGHIAFRNEARIDTVE